MIPGIVAGRRQAGGGGGGTDPLFANVRALLHFDGVNGATPIVDVTGRSWTRSPGPPGPNLSDVEARFGPTALRCNGKDGDYYDTNFGTLASAPIASATVAHVIEGWIWPDNLAGNQYGRHIICSQVAGGGNSDQFLCLGNSTGQLEYYRTSVFAGGALDLLTTSGGSPMVATAEAWNHFAMDFDGTYLRLFLNGVMGAKVATSRGWHPYPGYPFRLGRCIVPGYEAYRMGCDGFLDDLRVTYGASRYGDAGFTPPVAPYPDSA